MLGNICNLTNVTHKYALAAAVNETEQTLRPYWSCAYKAALFKQGDPGFAQDQETSTTSQNGFEVNS